MPNTGPNTVPACTHIKTNGVRCGSPAVKGTALCFHHSAVKTALGKVAPLDQVVYGAFTPIPFVFPEDRASMQINYFLLLQAINEQRIERRAADLMLRMLKAMDRNLGKSGSLVEDCASSDTQESSGDAGEQQRADGASGSASQPVNKEIALEDALSRVIDEVNASAPRSYADYREITALHPEGQRVVNLYCERPMGR